MDKLHELELKMTECSTDKAGRLGVLEGWKEEQNGDLKWIRRKGTATLVAIILLLVGVVTNLAINQVQPEKISAAVSEAVEEKLDPIVESLVHQVLESINQP